MTQYKEILNNIDSLLEHIPDDGTNSSVYEKREKHRQAIRNILKTLIDTTPNTVVAINILGSTIAGLTPYLGRIELHEFLDVLNRLIHTLAEKSKQEMEKKYDELARRV